jgi:hypothetical protein
LPAGLRNRVASFLDIGPLFVRQRKLVLDATMFRRYSANHNAVHKEKTMNRIRLLAMGTMLMIALITVAQQATTSADSSTKGATAGEPGLPTAEGQLKFLAARLDLTGDQQDKIKPILRDLHEATVKQMNDESISRETRLSKVRDSYYAADKRIHAILNDDQQKKLDQLEQEPHPELHGSVSGAKN